MNSTNPEVSTSNMALNRPSVAMLRIFLILIRLLSLRAAEKFLIQKNTQDVSEKNKP